MKADYTRSTFRVKKHYSSVRMQQGRVQMDADWNEQMDITAHRIETEAVDSVGNCGAPMHNGGFHIFKDTASPPTPYDGDFYISGGRYYVDGILCENEKTVPFSKQPDVPLDDFLDHLPADLPKRGEILKMIQPPSLSSPVQPGTYLVYLDVWSRHITALEDDEIREVALRGPDTATRTKTVWQVKLLEVPDQVASPALQLNCLSSLKDWDDLVKGPDGMLAAKVEAKQEEDDPCIIAAGAGYRRLENQLYRVEVHKGGTLGEATFKWSRDNGAVAAKWLGQDKSEDKKLIVSSTGRDDVLNFAVGHWVELTDDTRELLGQPGTLVQIKNVDKDGRILTIDKTVDRDEYPGNPRVRRWDSRRDKPAELKPQPDTGSPPSLEFIDLEDGVQVAFTGGTYRTGDYWLIPARTEGADVEWPKDENKDPIFQSPHGVRHHYCRLGVIWFDGSRLTPNDISDCRRIFPPVTELTSLLYVSGDGQEAMPGGTLDGELQVRVVNGQHPVAGAKVRFTVKPGGGTLKVVGSASPLTSDDGIARREWTLGTTGEQKVTAELLDAAGQPVPGQVICFNADLSVASEVAYDPDNCLFMRKYPPAPAGNVQDAIDRLCPRVTMVMAGGDGQEACVGDRLPQALRVVVFWGNRPYDEGSVEFEVTQGNATVDPATAPVIDGVATCTVTAGSLNNSVDVPPIRVTAKLVNPPGNVPAPPPVVFTARFVEAACVYVGSDVCPQLNLSNDNRTVSAILDHFCSRQAEPVIKVREIRRWDDQTNEFSEVLLVDDKIRAAELAEGLMICCDRDTPIDPATVDRRAVGTVSMELPSQLLRNLSLDPFAGRDPVVIAGRFYLAGLSGEEPNNIFWDPHGSAVKMLTDGSLFGQLAERQMGVDRLLVRVNLCSNFIWGPDRATGSHRYLDGGLFGKAVRNGAIVPGPVDNTQPGRNLEMRFYITGDEEVGHHVAVIPVLTSDFFRDLDFHRLNSVSRVFSLGVNREAPGLFRAVPPGFVLDRTISSDLQAASVLAGTVYPQAPQSPLRVVVPPSRARVSLSGLWTRIGEDLRGIIPGLEVEQVSANLTRRSLTPLLNRGTLDAVFGQLDVLRSLRSDERIGHHFGRPIVF